MVLDFQNDATEATCRLKIGRASRTSRDIKAVTSLVPDLESYQSSNKQLDFERQRMITRSFLEKLLQRDW